jgi:hypothetical protein
MHLISQGRYLEIWTWSIELLMDRVEHVDSHIPSYNLSTLEVEYSQWFCKVMVF